MLGYIKEACTELLKNLREVPLRQRTRFADLARELDLLNAREFEPAFQFPFMEVRRKIRICGETLGPITSPFGRVEPYSDKSKEEMITELSEIVDHFVGSDLLQNRVEFAFIRDPKLRSIAERDFRDLTLRDFPSQSWKSSVIMAGSILEALLHDLLTRDPGRTAQANATAAGKKKGDISKRWDLIDYIEGADELKLLPTKWAAGIHTVLREFRNYVHPLLEMKMDLISEGDAYQSVGALMRVIDHIRQNHP